MNKILSIIVPTYNMEDYLGRCLTSVLDHKWDEDLEVIVVNDGSKDHSLQIALEYKEKFPEIVTIIDKENGNHGSTINAGLRVAKGKYVKELDADDWFDTKEFERFIEQLKNIESDLVITHYTINYISGKKKQILYAENEYNKVFDFSMMTPPSLLYLQMHAISYRTELLRQINYKQTEGIFYTDQEWMFYPMFFVDTTVFINSNVYQYFVGREGQTMDMSIRIKNFYHHHIRMEKMISYYSNFNKQTLIKERNIYLLYRIKTGISSLYKFHLLIQPNEFFDIALMKKFDENIKMEIEVIYSDLSKNQLHRFIPFRYVWYWRKYSKRIPQWIIRILIHIGMLKY